MTPVLSPPANSTAGTELALDVTSPYSDPDGDALASADWQISRTGDFSILVLDQTVVQRTELTVASGILDPATHYFVRTRHQDVRGGVSEWSSTVPLDTAGAPGADLNHNGPATAYQVSGFVDTNGDGINDADEGICNLKDAQQFSVIGIEPDQGSARCYTSVPEQRLPLPPAARGNLPYGMFSFRIEGLPVNPASPAVVTLRVHLPNKPSGPVAWYKYDPATHALAIFSSSVTFEGDTAVLQLQDGGPGDADGVVNGVIVDPSGPVVGPLAVGGSGASGSTSGTSSIGFFGPVVVAMFGAWRRRARRETAGRTSARS